jgi:hypothetical protein
MASSYDKINLALHKCSEWRDYTKAFREMCEKAHIFEWTFERRYDGGINTLFNIDYGTGAKPVQRSDLLGFTFPSGDALPDRYLNEMVSKNFGQRHCPTYFCKKDKVETKWPEFARKKLIEENAELVNEMDARLVAQWESMKDSPELAASKQRFYERGAIDAIRAVVMKYYGKVTPEVLKEALDEVVAHAIMES